jgi:DNA-binding response OmpR family regulator
MSRRILVIEDDKQLRRVISKSLQFEGYDVIEAQDGLQGLEIFQTQPIDLVILDMIMPVKDGMETLMDLRVESPDLGIIAISGGDGLGSKPYLEMATAFGASCVLPKPFGRHGLIRAVQKTIESTIESKEGGNMSTILIADDDENICHILEKFLRKEGHRVITARGGVEALEKMSEKPDILLLDIMMPDMQGFKVLDRVKEINPSPDVIMMTGLDEHTVGVESLRRGACEFITKPIDLTHLERIIDLKILDKAIETEATKEAPWIPKER